MPHEVVLRMKWYLRGTCCRFSLIRSSPLVKKCELCCYTRLYTLLRRTLVIEYLSWHVVVGGFEASIFQGFVVVLEYALRFGLEADFGNTERSREFGICSSKSMEELDRLQPYEELEPWPHDWECLLLWRLQQRRCIYWLIE